MGPVDDLFFAMRKLFGYAINRMLSDLIQNFFQPSIRCNAMHFVTWLPGCKQPGGDSCHSTPHGQVFASVVDKFLAMSTCRHTIQKTK